MQIEDTSTSFPVFAQGWAAKRLRRHLELHGHLPEEGEIIGVKDYLSSLNEDDRIYQKLNKVSWKDAVQLQKNWHDAIARQSAKMTEFGGEADAATFIDCGNGHRWVRLETPEQFDFEGNAMGHCIGKGSYDKSKNQFYSLRDSKNLPHATVEFDPESCSYVQIKGKTNQTLSDGYFKHIHLLFERF